MKFCLIGSRFYSPDAILRTWGHELSNRQSADIILDCSKLTTLDEVVARIKAALIWDEIK